MGLIAPEQGRRRGAKGGIEVAGGEGGGPQLRLNGMWGLMARPDPHSRRRYSTQQNFFHPINLNINYFNRQIKDGARCLMSVR